MVKLGVLGSGSRGNAFVISSADGAIIVDVGFSRRETRCRMEQLHLRPERLDYDYDGERVTVRIVGIAAPEAPLRRFERKNYDGYELIDFR